jgi:hypothetical protein
VIPQVVASEKGQAQTKSTCGFGVIGLHLETNVKLNHLERWAIAGDSPVSTNH